MLDRTSDVGGYYQTKENGMGRACNTHGRIEST